MSEEPKTPTPRPAIQIVHEGRIKVDSGNFRYCVTAFLVGVCVGVCVVGVFF